MKEDFNKGTKSNTQITCIGECVGISPVHCLLIRWTQTSLKLKGLSVCETVFVCHFVCVITSVCMSRQACGGVDGR